MAPAFIVEAEIAAYGGEPRPPDLRRFFERAVGTETVLDIEAAHLTEG